MSKFNTQATQTSRQPNTVNRAGGAAYEVKDGRKELASVVLASMLNGDKYYQSDASRINQVFDLVKNLEDKEFAAKAMVYARQEGNLRSISHVLANALVENASGKGYLRSAIKKALVRPDDMTEMASLWFNRHQGKMLPNSMRRAFKDTLESGKWGAFQLRRYAGTHSAVKLRDIILLTHPKDLKNQFKGVIEGTIEAPASIEARLASGEKASEAFEDLLREGKLGYMAAVKNIRNALQSGLSQEGLDLWVKMISDPVRIRKSRMLPFRFYDAWEAVRGLQMDHFVLLQVKKAFNAALIASAENLDMFNSGDRVGILLDESGSMYGDPWKHAIVLSAVLYHALGADNVVVYRFSGEARLTDFGTRAPIDIVESFRCNGGATYFKAPMKELIRTKTKVDKLIVLTDMQLYESGYGWISERNDTFDVYLNEYKNKVNHDVMTLFWDLQGYGAGTPLELKENILLASGFSDKLLAVIPKMWKNENALIEEIEAIKL